MFPPTVLCGFQMDTLLNKGQLWDQNVRLSGQLSWRHLIKLQQMRIYANTPVSINFRRIIPYADQEVIHLPPVNIFLIWLKRFDCEFQAFPLWMIKICIKKLDRNPATETCTPSPSHSDLIKGCTSFRWSYSIPFGPVISLVYQMAADTRKPMGDKSSACGPNVAIIHLDGIIKPRVTHTAHFESGLRIMHI